MYIHFNQWGSNVNDTPGTGLISLNIEFAHRSFWKVVASVDITSVNINTVNVFWALRPTTQAVNGIYFDAYRLIDGSLSAAIINSVGLFWIAVGGGHPIEE